MTAIPQLPSPYKQPQDELVRVQIRVSPEDKYLLQTLYPNRGIESFLLCGVYHSLCNHLRESGITTYSPSNVRHLQDTIARYITPAQPNPERPGKHEQGRGNGVHTARKTPKNKPADHGKAAS